MDFENLKKNIDRLSDKQWSELLEWMTSQLDETEDESEDSFDPDFWRSTGPHSGPGGGEY